MKHILSLAVLAFLVASCSGNLGFAGESEEGAVTGKYKTITIVDGYMYAVNNSQIITFDLADSENPKEIDRQTVGDAIENMYETEKVLFIGSRTNLHIYAIQENGIPEEKSQTQYIEFSEDIGVCDPVVAHKDIAYVTLSSDFWQNDNGCPTEVSVNELRTYNVEDLKHPKLINTYQLTSPKGISVDGDHLFLSDGVAGFKVYELDHSGNVSLIGGYSGDCYDLIAKDNKLLVISEDEIRQYDYTNINEIVLYSSLDLR